MQILSNIKALNMENIKSFSLLSTSQVLLSVISFSTTLIWANFSSKEDYGIYLVLLSYLPIVGLLAYSGSSTSLEISSSKNFDGSLILILKKKFKAGLICTALFLGFFAYHIYSADSESVIWALIAITLLFPFRVISDSWIPWANGKRDFARYSFFKISHGLFILIITWTGILFISEGALIAPFVVFFYTVASLFILRLYVKNVKNDKICNESIRYGQVISGAFVLNGLLLFDKLIIGMFVGLSEVALYAIALAFSTLIKQSFDVFNKLITSKLAKFNSVKDGWNWFKYILYIGGGGYLIVALVGWLILEYVIIFFFGDKYSSASVYAVWFWVLTCLAVPSSLITSFLRLQGKTKYIYIIANGNATLKVLCLFCLTPLYGLWGVVAAHAVSLCVVSVISIYYLNHYRKLEDA